MACVQVRWLKQGIQSRSASALVSSGCAERFRLYGTQVSHGAGVARPAATSFGSPVPLSGSAKPTGDVPLLPVVATSAPSDWVAASTGKSRVRGISSGASGGTASRSELAWSAVLSAAGGGGVAVVVVVGVVGATGSVLHKGHVRVRYACDANQRSMQSLRKKCSHGSVLISSPTLSASMHRQHSGSPSSIAVSARPTSQEVTGSAWSSVPTFSSFSSRSARERGSLSSAKGTPPRATMAIRRRRRATQQRAEQHAEMRMNQMTSQIASHAGEMRVEV
mmetsp:Transcript_28993/g.49544  ORF Transcript_28993/g.49544 Transcript_28993/m.49544 type:complete len:278 (-) Transcript_28993:442-1275(-)|eukprot:CAMPEP_0206155058 /NCGR_PEP_ID=MMETSP1474-20131121/1862_1 /ASSEMBLY_ACC=CAM_ASM_001110 /TAXON_ID=97495 /ORGANISM="Imantonia sp., Strain RCC918" /LENGTH=277 /DNA_ID=CAMNT_0053553575 /DNA_START=186 /DNA_END=1019 /DNA_ORIENTATION=+